MDSSVVGAQHCCPVCGADAPLPLMVCGVCGQGVSQLTLGACPDCYQQVKRSTDEFLGWLDQKQFELFLAILDQGG